LKYFFFTRNRNKNKQNNFYFEKSPTRFNLAPTYLQDGESGLRSSMGRKLFVGCGFLVLKIFDIFLILEELVFFLLNFILDIA